MDSEAARGALAKIAEKAQARLAAPNLGEPERLAALLERGRALAALEDPAAESSLRDALDAAENLGDRAASRRASLELGAALVARGDATVGRAFLERALESATAERDATARTDGALAAMALAAARAGTGDASGAKTALSLARAAIGSELAFRAAFALATAEVARVQGDLPAARDNYVRAYELAVGEPGDPLERARVAFAAARGRARCSEGIAARELAALPQQNLATLTARLVDLALLPPSERPARALEAAIALLGAAGGELRAAERVLATSGTVEAAVSVARVGEGELRLQGAAERAATVGRALLAAALGAPGASAPAGDATPARVLALLEKVLGAGAELERLANVATDLAVEATGALRGVILVREPGERLGYRTARRAGGDLDDPAGVVSRSLVREAFLSGRAIVLADAGADPRHARQESIGSRGLRSVLVAPIPDAEGSPSPRGVLYLDDPGTVGRFGQAERELAIAFAARLGGLLAAVLRREQEQRAAASVRSALATERTRPRTRFPYEQIVGTSQAVGELLLVLDRAVPVASPVLVSGESGTGKELVARALHEYGPRAKKEFVALSCAALSDTVLESELFGHVKGAFTGAVGDRAGAFERAHQGTLFLDEIQEASPKLQAELLRVLETGEVRPVGSDRVRKVDVRLVAATNADLAALVTAGTFREDLYYRVNVLQLRLPPLRERVEDIPLLVGHFLERLGRPEKTLAPQVLERLMADPWPGNVRALRNCIERAAALAGPGAILVDHVKRDPAPAPRRAQERSWIAAASVELNERQLALIERLRSTDEITAAEYTTREQISQATGSRDLAELAAKGVIVRLGRGKNTSYALAPGWKARVQES